jgi:hypothetical protein
MRSNERERHLRVSKKYLAPAHPAPAPSFGFG